MDHVVGRLGRGEIAPRLGVRGIHQEELGPSASVQEAFLAVGEEFLDGPSFPVVVREGGVKAITPVFLAVLSFKKEPSFRFGRAGRVVGEGDKQEGAFVQSAEDQPLSAIDRGEVGGRVSPGFPTVGRDALGHPELASRVGDAVSASQGHQVAVLELDQAGVDARDGRSRISFLKIRLPGAIPRVIPRGAIVRTDLDGGPVMAFGAGVAGLDQKTLAGTDGTGDDLMPFRMFGRDEAGGAPRLAVIRAFPQGDREVLPIARGLDSVQVEQTPVPVVQQGGTGHVPVGHLEEEGGRIPFRRSGSQAGSQDDHPAAILLVGREPDEQQVAVIAPGEGRLVVVREEWAWLTLGRGFHVDLGRLEQGRLVVFRPRIFRLGNISPVIGNVCGFQGLGSGVIGLDDAEARLRVLVVGDHRHPVGRPEVFLGGIVTATTGHPIIAGRVADGVDLRARDIGTVPIETPLLDVAMHIVKAERVGRRLADAERDGFRHAGHSLVLLEGGGQAVARREGEVSPRVASVFPFRLGRQAIGLACFFREPSAIGRGLGVGDENDGLVVFGREAVFPS